MSTCFEGRSQRQTEAQRKNYYFDVSIALAPIVRLFEVSIGIFEVKTTSLLLQTKHAVPAGVSSTPLLGYTSIQALKIPTREKGEK